MSANCRRADAGAFGRPFRTKSLGLLPLAALCIAVLATGCAQPGARDDGHVLPSDPDAAAQPDRAVEPSRFDAPFPDTDPSHTVSYTVRKGDTLWSIAQRFGLRDWTEIVDANPGIEPENLSVGQEIRVPVSDPDAVPEANSPGGNPSSRSGTPRFGPASATNVGLREPAAANPQVRSGVAERRFAWPVQGRVACRFGQKIPWDPVVICRGVILDVSSGTRVRASKSGVAFVMQAMPGLGKAVMLDHGDGTTTTYGFNDEILVRHGEFVRQGEDIAVAGQTGRARGTQVYFRIDRSQGPVDPLPLLPR